MVLVPEREGEQPPQLARQVLFPGDVGVEQARDRLRPEKALPAHRLRRKRLARERLEVAPEPRGRRDREAALAAVHHLVRKELLDRLPEQTLLRQAANLVLRR